MLARYSAEGQPQPMRVVVYDVDKRAKRPEALSLAGQDYLGGLRQQGCLAGVAVLVCGRVKWVWAGGGAGGAVLHQELRCPRVRAGMLPLLQLPS